MIFVSVGTYYKGFDSLISAMDSVCLELDISVFAQIGHSSVEPISMKWKRFIPFDEMISIMHDAELIVCHGGMGVLGDAIRSGTPIIAVPRAHVVTMKSTSNNQEALVDKLETMYGIVSCKNTDDLKHLIPKVISNSKKEGSRIIHCNISTLIAEYLAAENLLS